mmetsp:Transcript_2986/g.7431  ORF Transcript_2986/g.7431 Transcript_2986/m.7431 type:complete len:222 (-) Transcript_2986:86-751(-)
MLQSAAEKYVQGRGGGPRARLPQGAAPTPSARTHSAHAQAASLGASHTNTRALTAWRKHQKNTQQGRGAGITHKRERRGRAHSPCQPRYSRGIEQRARARGPAPRKKKETTERARSSTATQQEPHGATPPTTTRARQRSTLRPTHTCAPGCRQKSAHMAWHLRAAPMVSLKAQKREPWGVHLQASTRVQPHPTQPQGPTSAHAVVTVARGDAESSAVIPSL